MARKIVDPVVEPKSLVEVTPQPTEGGLSKEAKLALFDAWAKARADVKEAAERVAASVRAIKESCGTGPFRYKDEEFLLVKQRKGDGVELRSKSKPKQVTEEIA